MLKSTLTPLAWALFVTASLAQSDSRWSLLPDGRWAVPEADLRTAAALRMTSNTIRRDGDKTILLISAENAKLRESIFLMSEASGKQGEEIMSLRYRVGELQGENERLQKKVLRLKPWADISKVIIVTAAVTGVILIIAQ